MRKLLILSILAISVVACDKEKAEDKPTTDVVADGTAASDGVSVSVDATPTEDASSVDVTPTTGPADVTVTD